MKKLLSIGETAKILGVHVETLREWDNQGKLVSVKTIGGHRRYRLEDIEFFYGSLKNEKTILIEDKKSSVKPTLLKFRLVTCNPFKLFTEVLNKINKKEWMGKESRSCKIIDLKNMGECGEFEIIMEHRPNDCVTFDRGGFWYEGWTLKHINVAKDGTLLDKKGNRLSNGVDPVVLSWQAFSECDFNDYEFGELISEEICDDFKPTRKFMWRYVDMPTVTSEFVFKNFPHLFEGKNVWYEGIGEPYPEAEVEIVNGEVENIAEDVMTYWVSGDAVELPSSPCSVVEWNKWVGEFLATHPYSFSEDGTFAKNVRNNANGMCFVITPKKDSEVRDV